MAELQVKYADGMVRYHSLDSGKKLAIGSSSKCDIKVEGSGVKSLHCTVSKAGGKFRVDVAEGVSAIVVGSKKTAGAVLKDKDVFKVGDCEVKFVEGKSGKDAKAKAPSATDDEYYQPLYTKPWFLLTAIGLVALVGGTIGIYIYNQGTAAQALFNKGIVAYDAKSYSAALKDFDDYQKQFPDGAQKEAVKVMKALATVRQFSDAPAPDFAQSLEKATEMMTNVGKSKWFKENEARYKEAAELIANISLGAAEKAKNDADPKFLPISDKARTMLEEKFKPEERPGDTVTKIQTTVQDANFSIEKDKFKKDLVKKIEDAIAKKDAMAVYRLHRELYNRYPDQKADKALVARRRQARDFEKDAVKFEPVAAGAAGAPKEAPLPSLGVYRRSAAAAAKKSGVVLPAPVADSVYGLDAGSGEVAWKLVTGWEPAFQPTLATTTKGPNTGVLIHSPLDGTIAMVDRLTGKDLWRKPAAAIRPRWASKPLVANNEVYVISQGNDPKADVGRLLVFSSITGEPSGQYLFPQRLTGSPAWDADRKRVLVLGEQVSLYSIDTGSKTCDMAIPLDHEADSVRASFVFSGRYLFVPEIVGPDRTTIRCFILSETDPEAKAKQSIDVKGQILLTPSLVGGKLHVTTNWNHFSVYELADEKDEKALAPVTRSGEQFELKSDVQAWPLVARDGELWQVLPNKLIARDVTVRGAVSTSVFEKDLPGTPLVAPVALPDVVVVFAQSRQNAALTAIGFAPKGGAELWRVELGRSPDAVSMDASGKALSVIVGSKTDTVQPADLGKGETRSYPFEAVAPGEKNQGERRIPINVRDWTDGVMQWTGKGGRQLFYFAPGGARKDLTLPAPVNSTPVTMGKFLIVPGEDGRLYTIDPRIEKEAADPFLGPYDRGQPIPLGPVTAVDDKTVICISRDKALRLEQTVGDNKVPRFQQALGVTVEGGTVEHMAPLGKQVLMVVGRELRAVDPITLKPQKTWNLGALIRREPLRGDGYILLLTDHQELISVGGADGNLDIRWRKKVAGEAIGWSRAPDGTIWVAFSDGRAASHNSGTGEQTKLVSVRRSVTDGPWLPGGQVVLQTPDGGFVAAQ